MIGMTQENRLMAILNRCKQDPGYSAESAFSDVSVDLLPLKAVRELVQAWDANELTWKRLYLYVEELRNEAGTP